MERLTPVANVKFHNSKVKSASRIGIGFEKLDRDVFDPYKAYDKVADLGVSWVRIQSGWMRTETEKGVYRFEWLDKIVDELLSRGLEPWVCLCYGNPVHTPHAAKFFGAVGCPPVETEAEREGWRNYVSAAVKHFAGRVTYWEVWNEPDLRYSWKHSWDKDTAVPNALEYAAFCKDTAIAIREADPNAKVIGFAVSHAYDLAYLNTALATGLYEYIDAVSFHVYASDDRLRPMYIENIRTLLDMYKPELELIQGEAGAQSRSDGAGAMKGFAWTPAKQTKYLLRGTVHDLAGKTKFSSYFTTMDMIEALNGVVGDKGSYLDYGYFGVLGAQFDEDGRSVGTYEPKPAYTALRTLASIFSGEFEPVRLPYRRIVLPSKRVHGNDCEETSTYFYGFKKPNGSSAMAYWNSTNILTQTYEGTITLQFFGQDYSKIQLIDLATGVVYDIPESILHRKESGEVVLEHLPLTDSPMLITFGDFAEVE